MEGARWATEEPRRGWGRPTQGSKSNKGVTLEPEMLGGKEICQSEGAGWATEEPRQVGLIED